MAFTVEFTIDELAELILEFQDAEDMDYEELCNILTEYVKDNYSF